MNGSCTSPYHHGGMSGLEYQFCVTKKCFGPPPKKNIPGQGAAVNCTVCWKAKFPTRKSIQSHSKNKAHASWHCFIVGMAEYVDRHWQKFFHRQALFEVKFYRSQFFELRRWFPYGILPWLQLKQQKLQTSPLGMQVYRSGDNISYFRIQRRVSSAIKCVLCGGGFPDRC